MKILTLSDSDIRTVLPYEKLIPHMKQALTDYSARKVVCPPRNVFSLDGKNALGYMPSSSQMPLSFGAKVAAVFPGNRAKNIDVHQGVVILFDSESGQPIAMLNASEITARRTAATSAAATDLLADKAASALTVFGFGVQAKEHIKAIRTIRHINTLKVYIRSNMKKNYLDIEPQYCKDIDTALEGSDIICLCTNANSPYLSSKQLPPGVHLNAIGACRPEQEEILIDPESILSIFVDSKMSTYEAQEINSMNSHLIKGEMGEVFLGNIAGRADNHTITIFKSVGLGIQDVYAAQLAAQEARRLGIGKEVDF